MQINGEADTTRRLIRSSPDPERAMRSSELINEIHALKAELAHALHADGDDAADGDTAGDIRQQVTNAVADLAETIGEDSDAIRKLVAERPLAALACAFAGGLAVGLLLRRR